MTESKPNARAVQLLHFEGCPNGPPVRAAAEAAVSAMGGGWRLEFVDLEALPDGDLRRGHGSPTLLVDGEDLWGEPAPASAALSCRHYADGLPTADRIRELLTQRA